MNLRITALMEDRPPQRNGTSIGIAWEFQASAGCARIDHSQAESLHWEHGLSFLVESEEGRYLFDTGASGKTAENAQALKLSLKDLDGVILSHSHYDHAGGYPALVKAGMDCKVLYIGPCFFEKKYSRDGDSQNKDSQGKDSQGKDSLRDLSAGFDAEFLQDYGIRQTVTEGLRPLSEHLTLVSGFPRVTPFETIPPRFVRQTSEGMIPDEFPDEQCLVVDQGETLLVLVGCSHPGILNMLTHIRSVFNKPISGVFGGTHLMEADEARSAETIRVLSSLGVEICGFCHCSGELAEQMARAENSLQACHLAPGDSLYFE